jgi:predicted CopG family antitoxin
MSRKTIKVSQETYDILSKQGSVVDSFDDVIQRLLRKDKIQAIAK